MHVPEIIEVKEKLENLKDQNIIEAWELPYENLLTRRSAAIFFLTPTNNDEDSLTTIWKALEPYENFSYRLNHEKKLSQLEYRITFSEEEKEKNKESTNASVAEDNGTVASS